jgi:hypothetical protein
MIPERARMKINANEGRRLISPVRSTYRRIEMRVSNGHRSSQGCGLTVPVVSVVPGSGSNAQLLDRSVEYLICPTGAIVRGVSLCRGILNNCFLLTYSGATCICPFLNFAIEMTDECNCSYINTGQGPV